MLSMKTLKNMSVTKKIESVAKKDTDTPTNIKMWPIIYKNYLGKKGKEHIFAQYFSD